MCRTFQGLAASGTWSVGNAVVADIYPMEIRGVAYGVFMMPGVRSMLAAGPMRGTHCGTGGGGRHALVGACSGARCSTGRGCYSNEGVAAPAAEAITLTACCGKSPCLPTLLYRDTCFMLTVSAGN